MTAFKRVEGGWESDGWRIEQNAAEQYDGEPFFYVYEPSGRGHGGYSDLNAAMMAVCSGQEAAEKPVEPLPAMSEKEFQQRVVSLAQGNGWLAFHTFDARKSEPGFPDLCMARDGTVIFAELKTESGKATAEQQKWLAALPNSYLWRPRDWPAVAEVLT